MHILTGILLLVTLITVPDIAWAAPVIVAGIGLTGISAAIATIVINVAISAIVAKVFRPDPPPQPQGAGSFRDPGVKQRIPTDPSNKLPVLYGENRARGTIIYSNISDDNQKMWFVIALSEGPINKISAPRWEDNSIKLNSVGYGDMQAGVLYSCVKTAPNYSTDAADETDDFLKGQIKMAAFPAGASHATLSGLSGSLISSDTQWTAKTRDATDVAFVYVELTYNRKKRVTGLTQDLSFLTEGRAVRQLSTDANGDAQAFGVGYSTNPAECMLDFLTNTTYGAAVPDSKVDLESYLAWKNFCDETSDTVYRTVVWADSIGGANQSYTQQGTSTHWVALESLSSDLPTLPLNRDNWQSISAVTPPATGTYARYFGGTTSGTALERYTCNGAVNTGDAIDNSVSDFAVGASAQLTYGLGKFGIIIDRPAASVFDFTDENLYGNVSIRNTGMTEVLNDVTVRYDAKDGENYGQEQQVRVQLSTGVTAGIGNVNEPKLERTIRSNFTDNEDEAERLAAILINKSRLTQTLQINTDASAANLEAGDVVSLYYTPYGIGTATDPKLYRVLSVEEDQITTRDKATGNSYEFLGVKLSLQEYSDIVYSPNELITFDPAPNVNRPNPRKFLQPAAVTFGTTTPGASQPNFDIEWIHQANQVVEKYSVYYQSAAAVTTPASFTDAVFLTDVYYSGGTDNYPSTQTNVSYNVTGLNTGFYYFWVVPSNSFAEGSASVDQSTPLTWVPTVSTTAAALNPEWSKSAIVVSEVNGSVDLTNADANFYLLESSAKATYNTTATVDTDLSNGEWYISSSTYPAGTFTLVKNSTTNEAEFTVNTFTGNGELTINYAFKNSAGTVTTFSAQIDITKAPAGASTRIDIAYADDDTTYANAVYPTGTIVGGNYVAATKLSTNAYRGERVVTYSGSTAEPTVSNTAADYTWSRIEGEDGQSTRIDTAYAEEIEVITPTEAQLTVAIPDAMATSTVPLANVTGGEGVDMSGVGNGSIGWSMYMGTANSTSGASITSQVAGMMYRDGVNLSFLGGNSDWTLGTGFSDIPQYVGTTKTFTMSDLVVEADFTFANGAPNWIDVEFTIDEYTSNSFGFVSGSATSQGTTSPSVRYTFGGAAGTVNESVKWSPGSVTFTNGRYYSVTARVVAASATWNSPVALYMGSTTYSATNPYFNVHMPMEAASVGQFSGLTGPGTKASYAVEAFDPSNNSIGTATYNATSDDEDVIVNGIIAAIVSAASGTYSWSHNTAADADETVSSVAYRIGAIETNVNDNVTIAVTTTANDSTDATAVVNIGSAYVQGDPTDTTNATNPEYPTGTVAAGNYVYATPGDEDKWTGTRNVYWTTGAEPAVSTTATDYVWRSATQFGGPRNVVGNVYFVSAVNPGNLANGNFNYNDTGDGTIDWDNNATLTPPTNWTLDPPDVSSLTNGQQVFVARYQASESEYEGAYSVIYSATVPFTLQVNDIVSINYDGVRDTTSFNNPGTSGYYLNAEDGSAVFTKVRIRGESSIGSASIGEDGQIPATPFYSGQTTGTTNSVVGFWGAYNGWSNVENQGANYSGDYIYIYWDPANEPSISSSSNYFLHDQSNDEFYNVSGSSISRTTGLTVNIPGGAATNARRTNAVRWNIYLGSGGANATGWIHPLVIVKTASSGSGTAGFFRAGTHSITGVDNVTLDMLGGSGRYLSLNLLRASGNPWAVGTSDIPVGGTININNIKIELYDLSSDDRGFTTGVSRFFEFKPANVSVNLGNLSPYWKQPGATGDIGHNISGNGETATVNIGRIIQEAHGSTFNWTSMNGYNNSNQNVPSVTGGAIEPDQQYLIRIDYDLFYNNSSGAITGNWHYGGESISPDGATAVGDITKSDLNATAAITGESAEGYALSVVGGLGLNAKHSVLFDAKLDVSGPIDSYSLGSYGFFAHLGETLQVTVKWSNSNISPTDLFLTYGENDIAIVDVPIIDVPFQYINSGVGINYSGTILPDAISDAKASPCMTATPVFDAFGNLICNIITAYGNQTGTRSEVAIGVFNTGSNFYNNSNTNPKIMRVTRKI